MVHKSGINSPVAGLVVHLPWFNRGLILHHPKPGQFFLAGFHTYSPHFNPPTCFAEPKVQARRWNEHTLAPPDIVVDITPHSALQYARSLPSWREMHRTCPPRSNWPLGLYHPADEPTNQVVVVVWTTRKHHGCLTCWPAKKTQQRNNNKKRGDPGKQKITDVFHHRKRMFFLKWSFLGEKWVKGKPPNRGELIHLKIELKVLCLLKIMYHLHIWKNHRETIFKAPEKYSKRFPESYVLCIQCVNFVQGHQVSWDVFLFFVGEGRIFSILLGQDRNHQWSLNKHVLSSGTHVFPTHTWRCCFFGGKSEGVFSQSLLCSAES